MRAWLSTNATVLAIAVVLLVLFAVALRTELHPPVLSEAVFASVVACVAAFAVVVLATLAAARRVRVTTNAAAAHIAALRVQAESDLNAARERAEASIRAARDAVQSGTESAAFFERLRFTQMLLDGRDIREPAEWLDNRFLASGGNIRAIRDELKRDLLFGNIDATRNALAIYNAIAAMADYYYSSLVVPEVIMSRMAVRVQLAAFYFGPAFSALGTINRTASQAVHRFLDDTKAYTCANETWLEQLVPEFYGETQSRKGAAFPVASGVNP